MLLTQMPRNLRVRCGIGNDPFQAEVLAVLGEITVLCALFVRQAGKLAFQLYEGLFLDLFSEGKFQLAAEGVCFRMELVGVVVACHRQSAPLV